MSVTLEFTDALKAHAFHAEALQYHRQHGGFHPTMHIVAGWYPETWQVEIPDGFYKMLEGRKDVNV